MSQKLIIKTMHYQHHQRCFRVSSTLKNIFSDAQSSYLYFRRKITALSERYISLTTLRMLSIAHHQIELVLKINRLKIYDHAVEIPPCLIFLTTRSSAVLIMQTKKYWMKKRIRILPKNMGQIRESHDFQLYNKIREI